MTETMLIDNRTGEIVVTDAAWERRRRIIMLRKRIEEDFLRLAAELVRVYEDREWEQLDCASFNAYLADPEVNISPSRAWKLMEVYERYIIAFSLEPVPLLTAGYKKLHKLLPYVDKENAARMVVWAGEVSFSDMQRELETSPDYSGTVSDRSDYTSDEWHTPAEYIEAAREVMGGIDLDPATNVTAQEVIQADTCFTKDDNGLDRKWHGRVWLNPPYSMPLVTYFVAKVLDEYDLGHIQEAVILVNNSSDTKWFHRLLQRCPACFTCGRVKFWHPQWKSFQTRQGQTFFYLGQNKRRFREVFSRFGVVVEKWRI